MSHNRSDRLPHSLAEWRDCLCDKDMPIFSGTVRRINEILNDPRTSATELAHVVMADPNLSAKVLKIGNSAYYNRSRQPIGTLTKAITLLGATVIYELAVTASYIEAIQSAKNRGNANRQIVDCLHAGVQAKSFAQLSQDPDPEEVFLAALLYNIGHVAFWCFEEQIGETIDHLLQTDGVATEDAERQVLGFRLRDLGAALIRAWQLKGLISEVHLYKGKAPPRVLLVQQAHAAVELYKSGKLESDGARATLDFLGQATGKKPDALIELIRKNTQTTVTIAEQYGVENAAALLLRPMELDIELDCQPAAEDIEATAAIRPPPPEDREAILQSIQMDISSQLSGDCNLNMLLEMVIEGIRRGIPMDRVLFALLDANKKNLKEKSAIGWPPAASRFPLAMPVSLSDQPPNIFTHALQTGDAVWIRPGDGPKWGRLYTDIVEIQFGRHECFVAPLAINQRAIGVIYADRAIGNAPLTQEAFNTFRHLTTLATVGLKLKRS